MESITKTKTSIDSDRWDIINVLNSYTLAMDTRDWTLLTDILAEDVFGRWNDEGPGVKGPTAMVEMIKEAVELCGGTHHQLGNYFVDVEGDSASASCHMRAFHIGRGAALGKTYEVLGRYFFKLTRTQSGWKVLELLRPKAIELGTEDVFRPN